MMMGQLGIFDKSGREWEGISQKKLKNSMIICENVNSNNMWKTCKK